MAERRLKLYTSKLPCEDDLSSRYVELLHPRRLLKHKIYIRDFISAYKYYHIECTENIRVIIFFDELRHNILHELLSN